MTILAAQCDVLRRLQPREVSGTVAAVRGLSLLVNDLPLPIGSLVRLEMHDPSAGFALRASSCLRGEVVGFDGPRSIVMLLGASTGVAPGVVVVGETSTPEIMVGEGLLGRVIDGLGQPLDGKRRVLDVVARPLNPPPVQALARRRIDEPLPTGVRVIDSMLTLGKGQRIGIFAGPGVGKSTLLGSIARNTTADVNVISLIGERGREVGDFLAHALGPEGLARSVVIVATGDQSPLLRVRAAMAACTVAEYFCERGADVMLMMDSITRFAQAQRQIGLTVGEQPATKGYTPSVFALMPMLLERAGAMAGGGSITGLYAVLVEGDDHNEPISDAAKGILDGHITLSRKLAARGHYPAVSVLESVSRVGDDVCDEHHVTARRMVLRLLAAYTEAEELINIGAYARGSNPITDVAMALKPAIDEFLQQTRHEKAAYPQTCRSLLELAAAAQRELSQRQTKAAAAGAPSPSPSSTRRT